MLTATEVMKKEVITIEKDAPITQAVEIMLENKISGLPVVKSDMTLVGIITEKDIMKMLYKTEEMASRVEDYMTTEIASFDIDADPRDIFQSLLDNPFRRVPIVKEGKLVGVISRKDLLLFILDQSVYSAMCKA